MAEIKKIQEGQVIDYMARDYESILNSMREIIPDKLPNWKAYKSEADFGNVLIQLFAHMGDILSYTRTVLPTKAFWARLRLARALSIISGSSGTSCPRLPQPLQS
jgi:hypothetical protein